MWVLNSKRCHDMKKKQAIIGNQKGSVLVIALLIMALMTLIGISASNMVVQESFITRNVGLYKQNTYLVESGIVEIIQDIMARSWNSDPNVRANLLPYQSTLNWIHNFQSWEDNQLLEDWYNLESTDRFLDVDALNNPIFRVPLSVQNDHFGIINIRGEKGNNPLRCAAVLKPSDVDSLKETNPSKKLQGQVMGEYVSVHGMVRMEAGVRLVVFLN
jgi:hypothetical protein